MCYRAKTPRVAVIGESPRNMMLLDHLDDLSRVSEQEINMHLVEVHLTNPSLLNTLGFRFDTELASFFDYSLQATADKVAEVVAALAQHRFKETGSFAILASLDRLGYGTDYYGIDELLISDDLVQRYDYINRLKAEANLIYELGLAHGDPYDTPLEALDHDSFFKTFRVIEA